jgi:chemotaxis protein CheD
VKEEICIYIGGYYASRDPLVIHTLLGSCVAVCLYDPMRRIGGMNHIFLPGEADMKHFDCAARYGINAMELLINAIMSLGGHRYRLVAKVFGGAHLLPSISRENGTGRKNIEFVMEFLKAEGIRIVSYDLGGERSRKVRFHTDTGDAYLKLGCAASYNYLADLERKSIPRVRRAAKKDTEIIWFKPGFQND